MLPLPLQRLAQLSHLTQAFFGDDPLRDITA